MKKHCTQLFGNIDYIAAVGGYKYVDIANAHINRVSGTNSVYTHYANQVKSVYPGLERNKRIMPPEIFAQTTQNALAYKLNQLYEKYPDYDKNRELYLRNFPASVLVAQIAEYIRFLEPARYEAHKTLFENQTKAAEEQAAQQHAAAVAAAQQQIIKEAPIYATASTPAAQQPAPGTGATNQITNVLDNLPGGDFVKSLDDKEKKYLAIGAAALVAALVL